MSTLPEDDMILVSEADEVSCLKVQHGVSVQECFMGISYPQQVKKSEMSLSPAVLSRFVSSLKCRLSPLMPRTPEPPCQVPDPKTRSHIEPKSPIECAEAIACFASHGPFGLVDLGASQTVIGQEQLNSLWKHLPVEITKNIRRIPCQTIFRFGNSSTVTCREALLVPLGQWYVRKYRKERWVSLVLLAYFRANHCAYFGSFSITSRYVIPTLASPKAIVMRDSSSKDLAMCSSCFF